MILVYGEEEKINHGNSNAQCERKHAQPPGANKKATRLGLFRAGDGSVQPPRANKKQPA